MQDETLRTTIPRAAADAANHNNNSNTMNATVTATDSHNNNSGVGNNYLQWVDYLPGQLPQGITAKPKRSSSMDHSNLTESDSMSQQQRQEHYKKTGNDLDPDPDMMDVEDWPDSGSLEGQPMMPHYLLVENDPVLQHELALGAHRVQEHKNNNNNNANNNNNFNVNISSDSHDLATACSISIATSFNTSSFGNNGEDPSVAPEMFANSLEELMEQRRRHLAKMMQASMQTRACLEPHIRQRAGFSNVLSQIERSSWTIREHLLVEDDLNNNGNHINSSSNNNNNPQQMHLHPEHDEEELPPPPPVETNTTHHHHNNNTNHHHTSSSANSILGDDSAADTCNSVDMTGISATIGSADDDSGSVDDFAAAVLNDPEDCLL